MKRVLLPAMVMFLATVSTPLTALAQSRMESRPDSCGTLEDESSVCNFNGAENGNTVISVYSDSIQRGLQDAVNFNYITSSGRVKNYAQVNCHESLDHWHRFTNEYHADLVGVSSYASHRMLNYVCEQADHTVGEQTGR